MLMLLSSTELTDMVDTVLDMPVMDGAYPYAYGGYGYPYAYGAYYGKRSADAEPEADAAYLYGAYGYGGWSWICQIRIWIPICLWWIWIPICLWKVNYSRDC